MKHVVITGSSRGIGFALAKRFLELGCRVTISGRTRASTDDASARLRDALPQHSGMVTVCACDVSRPGEIEALWQFASRAAPVDVWINNAGVSAPLAPLFDVPADALDDVVSTNVRGSLVGSQVALRGMRARGAGMIYNIVGFGSDGHTYPGALAYGMSKRAVGYLTRALCREARGSGVSICAMDPGAVRTDMVEATWNEAGARSRLMSVVIDTLALEPHDVALRLAPRLLRRHRSGALVRPWNPLVSWLRLLLVPLALLRSSLARLTGSTRRARQH